MALGWGFVIFGGCGFHAPVKLLVVFGNQAWVNDLNCAWIGFGGMWMFGGLLVMMRKLTFPDPSH